MEEGPKCINDTDKLILMLDLSKANIKWLSEVFTIIKSVIYNEIEYLVGCDRLNELYINYDKKDIKSILTLTYDLYNKMISIYNDYSCINCYIPEQELYINTVLDNINKRLFILKDNYDTLNSKINKNNNKKCIMNNEKKPKIMRKVKGSY